MTVGTRASIPLQDRGGQGDALLLIHGFLGSGRDWNQVIPLLRVRYHCYTVDLLSEGVEVSLESLAEQLHGSVAELGLSRVHLLGYSLGGRVAQALWFSMLQHCVDKHLIQSLTLEGAHPGLTTLEERDQRLQHDAGWATRFRSEPLRRVLADWYQQPVFNSLTEEAAAALVDERSVEYSGERLAAMLEGCSLATQADYRSLFRRKIIPVVYMTGEKDPKFQRLARELAAVSAQAPDHRLYPAVVAGAGHNSHRDNPEGFVQALFAAWDSTYFS